MWIRLLCWCRMFHLPFFLGIGTKIMLGARFTIKLQMDDDKTYNYKVHVYIIRKINSSTCITSKSLSHLQWCSYVCCLSTVIKLILYIIFYLVSLVDELVSNLGDLKVVPFFQPLWIVDKRPFCVAGVPCGQWMNRWMLRVCKHQWMLPVSCHLGTMSTPQWSVLSPVACILRQTQCFPKCSSCPVLIM